jgi:hypothetical protein
VLSIFAAALHLGLVVRLWKRLLLTRQIGSGSVEGEIELKVSAKADSPEGIPYLRTVVRRLQHNRAVTELLNETILSLDRLVKSIHGCHSDANFMNLLAYEISATLSLLKQFQRWFPRALTNL